MRKVDYELDIANLPLLARPNRLPPSPPADDLLTVDQKFDKDSLIYRGATPAMIDRYRLSYRSDVGLVATADAHLRNLFSIHPREILRRTTADRKSIVEVSEKRPWQIYIGRRVELERDDEDGSRFLEAFLDEVADAQVGFVPLSGDDDEKPEETWGTVVETFERSTESGDDSEEEQGFKAKRSSETRVSAWVTRRVEEDEELDDGFGDEEKGAVDGLLMDDSVPPPSLNELQKALKGSSPPLPDSVFDTLSTPIGFPASAQHRFSARLDKILSYRIDAQPDAQPEAPKSPPPVGAPFVPPEQRQTPLSPVAGPVETDNGEKKRIDEGPPQLHPPAAAPFVHPRKQQPPVPSLSLVAKEQGKRKKPVAALGEGVAPPAAARFYGPVYSHAIELDPESDLYDSDEVEDHEVELRAA